MKGNGRVGIVSSKRPDASTTLLAIVDELTTAQFVRRARDAGTLEAGGGADDYRGASPSLRAGIFKASCVPIRKPTSTPLLEQVDIAIVQNYIKCKIRVRVEKPIERGHEVQSHKRHDAYRRPASLDARTRGSTIKRQIDNPISRPAILFRCIRGVSDVTFVDCQSRQK